MKPPRDIARPSPHEDEDQQAGRPWIDRIRPLVPWLIVPLVIAAAWRAGLFQGEWRTARDALMSVDPRSLLPHTRLDLEPLPEAARRWGLTAAFAALVGALVWTRRGSTRGVGFFAACCAFSLSFAIETLRLFKPGQLPDFRDPLIALLVAPSVWWLLRRLPTQPVTPLPRHGPWGMRRRTFFRFLFAGIILGAAGVTALALPAVQELGVTPARIAAGVAKLPNGRTGVSRIATHVIAGTFENIGLGPWLRNASTLDHPSDLPYPEWTGARSALDGILPAGRPRPVTTVETLRQAIETALPGDVIVPQPGTYRVRNSYITFGRAGTVEAPITLRAARLGSVTIESELAETLKVMAPHWRFENLVLRGVCANEGACDNAFHVVGAAEDTVIRNTRIEDFNAQIKINGENGRFPDVGQIAHTTLINNRVRHTDASVTPIDLVAANDWVIEDNLIADFLKDAGTRVTYGAFAKGASHGTVFRRNVVLCEWRLRGENLESVGLSFGGGGTTQGLQRDMGLSGYEHADGIMSDNLIAFCSDDGIYLNRAANSIIRHNTLIGTSGIDARFPETTAQIDANLVDGLIRARDDGLFWQEDNISSSLEGMFLGRTPVREYFADPARFDLRWKVLPTLVPAGPGTDLCGTEWMSVSPAGAFRDFRACTGARRF